jgi:hypothetical protein
MPRILADLPDGDIKWLGETSAALGRSHASLIGDAVEWQRRERASRTRPWDDDHEEVKAEFPDLFDEDDDRQRQNYLDMLKGKYPEAIVNDESNK